MAGGPFKPSFGLSGEVAQHTTTIINDALGHMVEKNVGGTYTQIVYGPGGGKFAVMSGQTLQKAFIPLPTGATAVYTSAGLAYYRHSDHLGSSRLATTPSRTLYSSTAYAPFGEPYAEAGSTDRSFTGQDEDTTSGMYDFLERRYNPTAGRWLSPDPAGLGAVDPTNPQTWNRYAYVMNNPLGLIDLLGEECYAFIQDNSTCISGGGGGGGLALEFGGSEGGVDAYGNDIFDALAGAPGTYVTVQNGQLGFGTSEELMFETYNIVDAKRKEVQDNLPSPTDPDCQKDPANCQLGPYPFSGFYAELGPDGQLTGLIPDYIATQEEYQAAHEVFFPWGMDTAAAKDWVKYFAALDNRTEGIAEEVLRLAVPNLGNKYLD